MRKGRAPEDAPFTSPSFTSPAKPNRATRAQNVQMVVGNPTPALSPQAGLLTAAPQLDTSLKSLQQG
jgi:hypothetical protein